MLSGRGGAKTFRPVFPEKRTNLCRLDGDVLLSGGSPSRGGSLVPSLVGGGVCARLAATPSVRMVPIACFFPLLTAPSSRSAVASRGTPALILGNIPLAAATAAAHAAAATATAVAAAIIAVAVAAVVLMVPAVGLTVAVVSRVAAALACIGRPAQRSQDPAFNVVRMRCRTYMRINALWMISRMSNLLRFCSFHRLGNVSLKRCASIRGGFNA